MSRVYVERGVGLRLTRFGSTLGWSVSLVCLLTGSVLAASPSAAVGGYGDVAADRYFTEAVQWSVDNDIAGVGGNCFLPEAEVTRGEAAIYIWRMEGQPSAPLHSYGDITNDGQHAAVSWMSHSGITTGTSPTTFAPDTTLTRAHLVTFLHRLASEPFASPHGFVDVHKSWQQASVSWAAATGITTGTLATTFAPDTTLTRAHLVTFLWRYKGKPAVTVDPVSPTCERFTAISAGAGNTCGIRPKGTIECWGWNVNGQSNPPSGHFAKVAAGQWHSCGLRIDGTIACWGDNSFTQSPEGIFKALSADQNHSCGLRINGAVECWGNNRSKQSDAPTGSFSAVSSGATHSCGLRTNGTIACWGSNRDPHETYHSGQSNPPEGQFTSIAASGWYSCGLRIDATIACWGENAWGQLAVPAGTFSLISAGASHACGLQTDNTVACWGSNGLGESDPPAGKFATVSAGGGHSCGLRTNGTIECWGANHYGESEFPAIRFTRPPAEAIQAVYVVPADKMPVEGRAAAIRHEIEVVQEWYDSQTGGTHPQFVRDGDAISVATVTLSSPLTESSTAAEVLVEIRAALSVPKSQPLFFWVEGRLTRNACGWASGDYGVIPINNCDIRPMLGSQWPYGATYLLAHEVAHLLGAVPECAPNADGTSHVSDDPRDLLYWGPEPRHWNNLMLDPGNDDYFNHGRDDCFDIADSPLMGSA